MALSLHMSVFYKVNDTRRRLVLPNERSCSVKKKNATKSRTSNKISVNNSTVINCNFEKLVILRTGRSTFAHFHHLILHFLLFSFCSTKHNSRLIFFTVKLLKKQESMHSVKVFLFIAHTAVHQQSKKKIPSFLFKHKTKSFLFRFFFCLQKSYHSYDTESHGLYDPRMVFCVVRITKTRKL